MSYDTTKLTKLAALKSLAEQVASDYATKTEVSTLSDQVSALEAVGSEANVLEGVQVNGTALTIADKIVNILIATGTANGTIAANGVDIAVKGLASLAYLDEVSEDELSSALAATIAAKAESTDLTALANLVGTLPTDAASTTVVDYIAEAVAEIVAGADESYDTLKEIADWISSHADSASAMNSAISDNADAIAALAALVGTLPTDATSTTVIGYIAEAIEALSIGDYVTTAALTSTLAGYVQVNGTDRLMTEEEATKLAGIEESANNYTHPTYTAYTSGLYNVTVDTTGHVSAATAVTKSDITALGIPESDTTYSEATTTTAGLMSASDKTKLDGIEVATDAEVSEMLAEIFTAA